MLRKLVMFAITSGLAARMYRAYAAKVKARTPVSGLARPTSWQRNRMDR